MLRNYNAKNEKSTGYNERDSLVQEGGPTQQMLNS